MLVTLYSPRDPEVGDQGAAVFGQQQVLRLDVPVSHALVVCVLEGLGRLPRDPERFLHRELLLPPQPVPQRLALDVRHGEPEVAGGLARVVNGEDVGMLQACGELDLPLEPVGPDGDGELRKQHLQRDGAVVLEVASQVDGGHAAAPELALEHVAVAEGLAEVWKWSGHWPERGRCFNLARGEVFRQPHRGLDQLSCTPATRETAMRVRPDVRQECESGSAPPDVPRPGAIANAVVTGGAPGPKVSGMDQQPGASRFCLASTQFTSVS